MLIWAFEELYLTDGSLPDRIEQITALWVLFCMNSWLSCHVRWLSAVQNNKYEQSLPQAVLWLAFNPENLWGGKLCLQMPVTEQ